MSTNLDDCYIRVFGRFHDKDDEPSLDHNIIPLLDDNVQLSIEEYRDNLYEVCSSVCVCLAACNLCVCVYCVSTVHEKILVGEKLANLGHLPKFSLPIFTEHGKC